MLVDERSTQVPLHRFCSFAMQKSVLRPLLAQVLVAASWQIELSLGKCVTAPATKGDMQRVGMRWLSSTEADLVGNRLEKSLASHVYAGRLRLAGQRSLGIATDKASVKTLSLQNSIVFSPASLAVLCCPQAGLGGLREPTDLFRLSSVSGRGRRQNLFWPADRRKTLSQRKKGRAVVKSTR